MEGEREAVASCSIWMGKQQAEYARKKKKITRDSKHTLHCLLPNRRPSQVQQMTRELGEEGACLCVCVYTYVCLCLCIHMYVCVCVCVCVCGCV